MNLVYRCHPSSCPEGNVILVHFGLWFWSWFTGGSGETVTVRRVTQVQQHSYSLSLCSCPLGLTAALELALVLTAICNVQSPFWGRKACLGCPQLHPSGIVSLILRCQNGPHYSKQSGHVPPAKRTPSTWYISTLFSQYVF